MRFEFSLNFKGIQTSWEKSHKFSKIIIFHVLHKYNFRSPYFYSKIPCSFTMALWTLREAEKIGNPIGANDLD
jgi:hypothetical protein